MIIFVGQPQRGFFAEDIARKLSLPFSYIDPAPKLQLQQQAILGLINQGASHVIYDIDQYDMSPFEIADAISQIEEATRIQSIIYAPGYLTDSKAILALQQRGLSYFITQTVLSDQKDMLEAYLSGTYTPVTKQPSKTEGDSPSPSLKKGHKLIGLTGAMHRIGTTTHAIQLVKYLNFKGYNACYIQMNGGDYLQKLREWFEVQENEELGEITYESVKMYYKPESLPEIMTMDYDFYIYDYGTYHDADFNRTSYLEKDFRLIICGSNPVELPATYDIIKNSFYSDVFYIFNYIPESERNDILELMQDKADRTFICSSYLPDPFVLHDTSLYDTLLQIPDKPGVAPHRHKKSIFWRRKGKRHE